MSQKKKYRTLCILLLLASAASLFLLIPHLRLPDPSHDMQFHLARIAGTADCIRSGQWSCQIQESWMNGKGYAVSAFYPDLFLIPSALLTLCGVSLENSYKLLLAAINFATCFIGYYSFRRLFHNERTALFAVTLYLLAPYRLTDLYLRSALGECLAMIFLPLAAGGMHTCYQKEDKKGWMLLAMALAGICASHLLSLFFAGFFLLLYALLHFSKTFQKETFLRLCKAILAAVILSLWFLVPYAKFSRNNILRMNTEERNVWQEAAKIWELLIPFSPTHGGSAHLDSGVTWEMPFYLGYAFLIPYFLECRRFLHSKKKDSGELWILLLTLLSILMCTWVFPWKFLQGIDWTNWFVTKVQYPWRNEMMAVLFLSLSAGYFFQNHSSSVKTKPLFQFILALALVQTAAHGISLYCNTSELTMESSADIDWNDYMGGEFLPSEFIQAKIENDMTEPESEKVAITDYQKDGLSLTFHAENDTDYAAAVTVPLVYYKEYTAVDDQNQSLVFYNNGDGLIRVMIPAHWSGTVSVSYTTPWHDYAAMAVSAVTLAGITVWYFQRKKLN